MKAKATASPSLVWFRQDLRLADNPALTAAIQRKLPIIPVYIWAPEEEAPWAPGGASEWWLHGSLLALDQELRSIGSRLVFRLGPTQAALASLIAETGASAVFWNRRYEPAVCKRDSAIKESLRSSGIEVESFNAALLHEPWTIQNKTGKPFQVFTPFWKHCLALPAPEEPIPTPSRLSAPSRWPTSGDLAQFKLQPVPDWAGGLRSTWQPGTAGASANLKAFLAEVFSDYSNTRNQPALVGTSRLSPHLHYGEISPRQIWHAVLGRAKRQHQPLVINHQFLTEIGWREFSHHLLYHFPHTDTQ